jgi:hypothetical protein
MNFEIRMRRTVTECRGCVGSTPASYSKFPVSNIGPETGYPDGNLSWLFSVRPGTAATSNKFGSAPSIELIYHRTSRSHSNVTAYRAEVPKLWGALLVLWGGGTSCLYEDHIYFQRNMDAEK